MARRNQRHRASQDEARSALVRFIEAARAKGTSDEFTSKLLRSFGWSQREIESAFRQIYERLTGLPLPIPIGQTGESAKDAFVYLLTFSMLALWTQALGQLGFIFIDLYIPSPLARFPGNYSDSVAFSLARLITAFPLFLFVMGIIAKELRANPEKYHSGVRKWLTYLALLVAALIAVGNLIVFLSAFLRGDLTLRFILKVLVVLILAGSVLWYYFAWLQRQPRGPS